MSESYIEVEEGTGKRLRTARRTVAGNEVHEEIVALVDVPSGTILSTTIPTVALPVRLTDGTSFYTASGGAASTVHVSNTVEVTATGLDIRTITETIPVDIQDANLAISTIDMLKAGTIDLLKDGTITPITSIIDTNNSTTVPLASGGTFTGTGTDLLSYSNITTQLHADVDSAIDGMQFQFSTDNVNWDESYNFNMDVSDENIRRFQFPVQARYYRINYINGGSTQSAFRVQTMLHRSGILTSIHRAGDPVTDDRSAQLVKSIITGKKPSGDFVNVQTTTAGNLKISIEEFDPAVSLPDGSNTIGVTQRDWTITETVPISATNLDIRDITETISVDLKVDSVGLLQAGQTISTDRTWTISETIPIDIKTNSAGLLEAGETINVIQDSSVQVYGTDVDIRTITETIPVDIIDNTCTWASTFGTQGTTTVWDPSGSQVRIKYVSYSNRTGVSGRINLQYTAGDEILPITLGSLGIFASNIVSGNLQGNTLSMVIDTVAMTVDVFVIGEEI